MLRYASIITRIVDFVGFLPLYFFGFKEHTQTLQVLMFPHLVDDYVRELLLWHLSYFRSYALLFSD